MKEYQHQCIKPTCQTTYSDEDLDPYYCEDCTLEKNKIAAQIDAKFAGAPKVQPMSTLQEYDAAAENIHGKKLVRVKA